MILASHNSWTYLSPKKWWMRLFAFAARCQQNDIRQQYHNGARMFDLRIRFDSYGNKIMAHGLIEYPTTNIKKDLEFLQSLNEDIYIRIILETGKENVYNENLFKEFCYNIKEKYNNIKFFGGRRKYDWKVIFDFGIEEPCIKELHASVVNSKIDDLYPYLYAKRNNDRNVKNNQDYNGYLMIDFI